MMFHDVRSAELTKNRATDLCARQRLIIPILPLHCERREMPILAAGHAGAVGVHRLMARPAVESSHAFVLRAANDIGKVAMPVISLLRIVGRGMTVDAARACEYRIDLLPGCQSVTATGALQHDREQKDCS